MRLFILFSIILFSCSNDPELVRAFIITENLPIEKIDEAEILHTEHGILKVKILASNARRFKNIQPELVFSNGLEVIFYNDAGLVKSVPKAENGQIDEIKKIMIASDNVILTSLKGRN